MALDSTILEIKDLQVSINEILKELKVNRGEIHAIMGVRVKAKVLFSCRSPSLFYLKR
jgi:hypothetical protein